jgi:hypothetical protein
MGVLAYNTGYLIGNEANKICHFCHTMIHIGQEIEKRAKELRVGPTELARRINKSRQNVQDIFERKSIDTDLLEIISRALDFDFFVLYQPNKTDRVLELQEDLLYLRKQNRVLTDVLDKSIKPLTRQQVVSKIVAHLNKLVTVTLSNGDVKSGIVYLNKKTGYKLDDVQGVIIVPVKNNSNWQDLVQQMHNQGDESILEIEGEGIIALEDIEEIIPAIPFVPDKVYEFSQTVPFVAEPNNESESDMIKGLKKIIETQKKQIKTLRAELDKQKKKN